MLQLLVDLLAVGQCDCEWSTILQLCNDAAVVQIYVTAYKLFQLVNLIVVGQCDCTPHEYLTIMNTRAS
jgi:hypothetical protein